MFDRRELADQRRESRTTKISQQALRAVIGAIAGSDGLSERKSIGNLSRIMKSRCPCRETVNQRGRHEVARAGTVHNVSGGWGTHMRPIAGSLPVMVPISHSAGAQRPHDKRHGGA